MAKSKNSVRAAMAADAAYLRVVADNTQAVLSALDSQIAAAFNAIGLKAVAYAKASCPVDTGRLRASITYETDVKKVYVGSNVEYAPYVELGTRKRAAQPFLTPAAKNHGSQYKAILKKYLQGA